MYPMLTRILTQLLSGLLTHPNFRARTRSHSKIKNRQGDTKAESEILIDFHFGKTEENIARFD
jgi:hypothetical protein